MKRAIREKLWEPQLGAINKISGYLKAFKDGQTAKSALVHLPTGTGKTGVIACLSRFAKDVDNVLVVTPREALRDQLYREINQGFFQKINFGGDLPKAVFDIRAGQDFPEEIQEPTVIATTIHKLKSFADLTPISFQNFVAKINLLIFDEGHYEPASSWTSIIRSFTSPKIIFTATPFRNDFKPFEVDRQHIYSFSYHRSVELNLLRQLEIVVKPAAATPEEFVDDVIAEFEGRIPVADRENCRIIVRCDSPDGIRRIATVFAQRGEQVVAIHDKFVEGGQNAWEFKRVPNPEITPARIWIHQYKLLEGIDDPRFRFLATYDHFRDTRQIIQQVGRIVRNPGGVANQRAYFLDYSNGFQESLWNEYLEFDRLIEGDLTAPISEKVVELAIPQLPAIEYIDGRFRRKLDLSTNVDNVLDELNLPLTCNLIETLNSYSTANLCDAFEKRLVENDCAFQMHQLDDGTTLYLYVTFNNSKFLSQRYFIDSKLNICIFRQLASGYLALYDSSNYLPKNLDKVGLGKAVSPKIVKKLISDRMGSRLTTVSLKNSSFGARSIHSHSFSAASIENTTPYLDDHANVVSSMIGQSSERTHPLRDGKSLIRRYLGLANGRVTEASGYVPARDFLKWIEYLDTLLQSANRRPISTVRRYGIESPAVTDGRPSHILLDFEKIGIRDFVDVENVGRPLDFDELSQIIASVTIGGTESFSFSLSENGNPHTVSIVYDNFRQRYELRSNTMEERYFNSMNESIITVLNREQAFRIIPKQKDVIYVNGEFYNPAIKVGSRFIEADFHVGQVIHTDGVLQTIGSEKGANCKADESGWDDNSLFSVIDSLGAGTASAAAFGAPDLLICDDLGTEIADFIISDPSKVIFVHVKGTGNTGDIHHCSASSLQEVCGQATKNIQYLSMFNQHAPKNLNNWSNPWSKNGIGVVQTRIRRGAGTPKEIWNTLQSRINNPLVDREVWIFLGRVLSKSALIERISKAKPTPESIQAAILLHATMTSVSSIGGKLRVFCHP